MKYISQAKHLGFRYTWLHNAICHYLGMESKDLAEMKLEQGLGYLDKLLCCAQLHQLELEQMKVSRYFWNWWKKAWMARDEEFLEFRRVVLEEHGTLPPNVLHMNLMEAYKQLNDGVLLAEGKTPNGVDMEIALTRVINRTMGEGGTDDE